MSETDATIATDVGKALEVLPIALNTIETAQSDVATDAATHQSIVATGLDVASTVATSLTALAQSGDVGAADAAHVDAGVAVATDAMSLAAELDALIAKIKAAFSWL